MKQYKIRLEKGGPPYVGIMIDGIPYLSIREATKFLGYKHAQYTRRLLLEGKLDTPLKATRVKEKNFSKWYIPIPSLVNYQASRVVRDSRRRYTLRMERGSEAAVRAAIDKAGVTYDLELSYKKGKAKPEATPEVIEALEEFTYNPK